MLRWALALVFVALVAAAGLFIVAGRAAPPAITIAKPDRTVGQKSDVVVDVVTPGGRLTNVSITLEQNGRTLPLFALDAPQSATTTQPAPDHLTISRPFGKLGVPELQAGSARLVVAATRRSILGLRAVSSTAAREIQIRLEPPRIAVLSTHHYINHGGSEMVVYRATPADVTSGVRVGTIEYTGYPATGAGMASTDPAVHVAFFALLHDQDLHTPIVAFARDDAGNEAHTSFIDNVFEKPFKKSRIDIDDRFLSRVVPEILEHSPEAKAPAPPEDLLRNFLFVNGDIRRMNAEQIMNIAKSTSDRLLIKGPFVQLGNTQVEASFADHRTYLYQGKEVDAQVHLGFDLASTARTPVLASNDGTVLHAAWLGIYGQCVIIDHGMGVASLYGHLSSFEVKAGDHVAKGQTIGRSGMTGMAGGDHLHFTMLVAGRPVNPVEWWDPHWLEDRVTRKLQEAGGENPPSTPPPSRPAAKPKGAPTRPRGARSRPKV